ncbi:response regulator [Phytomonospora endophytica]|uniref:DNA-binding NarL/FixJ family response regulator n=1 Tax=Phytomonospora endophytica TaxID=714109 RepID=A0A841G237_9ACTN|nr:response regulator transcription factor [Phytomonospora endophytica]MBB6039832.1 DNA-binding NarL/FixJ family response regulator [Phytomonospora endophytica]GIG70314.1 DNA-binding response regulator [Phytomonospora endophytica]
MIRVLLADDQALVREAFALLIDSSPDFDVVAEASTGADALAAARRTRPDVVVMDLRMPCGDGIEATARIVAELPEIRVLVLTTYDDGDNVAAALRAGASGFLAKDCRPAQLLDAIGVVAAGEALLSPGPTAALIARFLRAPEPATGGLGPLTVREREIVRLIARGLSNAEIARALVLSHATVKTHVSRILTKLGLRDRVQLAISAYENGLVVPGKR